MTRYEYGFLTKCAEYGVDGAPLLKAAGISIGDLSLDGDVGPGVSVGLESGNGGIRANLSGTALHNAALGAGLGALTGLAHEKMKDPDKRKRYLRAALLGLLTGGSLGAGATLVGDLPDYAKILKGKIDKAKGRVEEAADDLRG